jgi:hypothetical protein
MRWCGGSLFSCEETPWVVRRRVICTSLRVTLTLNPRRVSMGLSRLPSPKLCSTHACDWSWWWFTSEFPLYIQPSITTFVVSGNCYGKWPTSCNTELLSMILENTLLYFLQPGVAFRALRNLEFTNSQSFIYTRTCHFLAFRSCYRRLGPRA